MTKKKQLKRINVALPTDLLEEIDNELSENFITRTKWFLDAALLKLKKDNEHKIDKIVKGN